MPTRWEVEKAVVKSNVDAPGRHIVLTLLVSSENDTAVIQPSRAPSLSRIAAATGLGRTTVAEHLGKLERAGWVVRYRPTVEQARVDKVCTSYALRVGLPEYLEKDRRVKPEPKAKRAGLVQETDQPNRAKGTAEASTPAGLARGASTPDALGLVRQPDGASTSAGHNKDPQELPSKNPIQPSAEREGETGSDADTLPLGEKFKTTKTETKGQKVNRLTRLYTDRVKLTGFMAAQNIVRLAVDTDDYSDDEIAAGMTKLADERRTVSSNSLRIAIEGDRPSGAGRKGTVADLPTDDSEYFTEIG